MLCESPFCREPYIGKTLGVADTIFKDADNVRAAADMRVHETIDELGRAGFAFGIKTIEGCFETVKIKPGGIFVVEQEAQVVGIVQPRHGDEWLGINNAMLRDIGSRQVAGPENAFINVVAEAIFVDSMAGTDPADRAPTGHRRERVQSSPDEFFF